MIFSRLNLSMITAFFLVLYPFANSQAFDGKRKGLFFGVGTGPGISVEPDRGSYPYGITGFTLDYKIGYAPSERFLIYLTLRPSFGGGYTYNYDNQGNFHHADLFAYSDVTCGLGFMLFPSQSNNFYFSGCFGLGTTIDYNYLTTDSIGFGVSGGIGYEIVPNLAVDLTLDYRRLTYVGGYEDFDVVSTFSSEVFEYPPDNIVTLSLAFNFLFY